MGGITAMIECVEILSTDGLNPPRQLVFRGRAEGDEDDLCVKIMNYPSQRDVLDEMLQDLNGDFAVQVHRIEPVLTTRWVVMDYCDCSIGDAVALLQGLEPEEMAAVAYGTLKALAGLHNGELAHANIKPNNMLIQERQIILADQGLSQLSVLKSDPHPARIIPEGQDSFDLPPADIWALGVSLIEMVDRVPPFYSMEEDEVEARLEEGGIPEIVSERVSRSEDMDDFVAQCLEPDANRRRTYDELLEHPFVRAFTEDTYRETLGRLVTRFEAVLEEWAEANSGKAVPRAHLKRLFHLQVQEAMRTSRPVENLRPVRLDNIPEEGYTRLPAALIPEKELEPVVLKDKTAGEFVLSKPDPEATPVATVIQNVSKVKVFMLGPNLSVTVQRMTNSMLVIGPCKERVKLEGLENVQVAVAAKRVELERCTNVEFISLYSEEPLLSVRCQLNSFILTPWHFSYPHQAAMMRIAGLDPYTNRWNELATPDLEDTGSLRLLSDPYKLFHETTFPVPGMETEESEQAVYKRRNVAAPVRPDDEECISIVSMKQVCVVKRPGEMQGRSVHLENNDRCEFLFLDSMAKVELNNLNACQVVLGPTDSLTVKGLVGCVVIALCQEIQIIQCSETCVFLWSATPPIVANCAELELAAFNVVWPLLDKQVEAKGWKDLPNMYQDVRDASPRNSSEANLFCSPAKRVIPILNHDCSDLIAPLVAPFEEINLLEVDETVGDFAPILPSPPRRTLSLDFPLSQDSFIDLNTHTPQELPAQFATPSGVCLKQVFRSRITYLHGTLSNNVVIEAVQECEIFLLDSTESVTIKGVEGSRIVVGPVAGRLTIEECSNSTIVAAASQIVVKGAKDCKLSLWCGHDFVLHRSAVEISPWNIVYPMLRMQAIEAFGEERLSMPSRHTKIFDLSKDDVRCPEPHFLVYPSRDVNLEELRVEGLDVSDFPFTPAPTQREEVPERTGGTVEDLDCDDESTAPVGSTSPFSPSQPEPVQVTSPNAVSTATGERIERKLGSLRGGGFDIDRAVDCEVVLLDVAETVTLSDCTGCSFVIGPCKGVVVATNLRSCKIWCVAQAFTAVNLKGCQLHLLCPTPPTFIDTEDTTLSPFNARLPGLPEMFQRAGLHAGINNFDKPVLTNSTVAQPDYVGILHMQSFRSLTDILSEPASMPEIEALLLGRSADSECSSPRAGSQRIASLSLNASQAGSQALPTPGAASPVSQPAEDATPLFQRAVAAAIGGEEMVGPWEVEGESLPTKAKWDKSQVTACSATFFRGKTVVIPASEEKEEQQVELAQLHDCRVVVLGSCDSYTVDDCTNCELVLGPCQSSIFIRDCADLCITVACRQLRMRDVSTADFFVHTETDPCVESSTRITLHPYNMRQPLLAEAFKKAKLNAAENRFRHAADFNTFSDPNAKIGFTIPDWVGVVSLRSVALEGHGGCDVPEGVVGILTGELEGGESLEKGGFRAGMSQKEAQRAFEVREGLRDVDDVSDEEAAAGEEVHVASEEEKGPADDEDNESELTLDSGSVASVPVETHARSELDVINAEPQAEAEAEAEAETEISVAAKTAAFGDYSHPEYRKQRCVARRMNATVGFTLSAEGEDVASDLFSRLPPIEDSEEDAVLFASFEEALQKTTLVVAPPAGVVVGSLPHELEVDSDSVLVQGAIGITVGVEAGTSRIILDTCSGVDVYTAVVAEVWLVNCVACSVYTIADKLRVFGSKDCNLNIHVTEAPLFERSTALKVRPWSAAADADDPSMALLSSFNHYDKPFDLSKPGLASSPPAVISTSSAMLEGMLNYQLLPAEPGTLSALLSQQQVKHKLEYTAPAAGAQHVGEIREVQCKKTPEVPVPEPSVKEEIAAAPTPSDTRPLFQRAVAAAIGGEEMVGPWEVEGESLPTKAKWDKSQVTACSATFFRGKTVVIPASEEKEEQQVELAQLHDCRVVVLGSCDSYTVDDCTNCELVLGPCQSSIFIRDCADLCITVACRQLRMRDVSTADFFVHTETDPCVESSTRITLHPYNMRQPLLAEAFKKAKLNAAENRFRHAADFNTFSDPNAKIGFTIPDWVGVVSLRSVALEGHGGCDVPEGVVGILTGELEGGESLEKGGFRAGMSQKEAQRAFEVREGLRDVDDVSDEEAAAGEEVHVASEDEAPAAVEAIPVVEATPAVCVPEIPVLPAATVIPTEEIKTLCASAVKFPFETELRGLQIDGIDKLPVNEAVKKSLIEANEEMSRAENDWAAISQLELKVDSLLKELGFAEH